MRRKLSHLCKMLIREKLPIWRKRSNAIQPKQRRRPWLRYTSAYDLVILRLPITRDRFSRICSKPLGDMTWRAWGDGKWKCVLRRRPPKKTILQRRCGFFRKRIFYVLSEKLSVSIIPPEPLPMRQTILGIEES